MNWRKGLYGVAVAVALTIVTAMQMQSKQETILMQVNRETWPFALPRLPFSYDALEPAIDTKTVEVHYSRHHKAYVDALNKAMKGTDWTKYRLEELFSQASKLPTAIRNNVGGHWNHTFYWNCIRSPMANPGPSKKMLTILEKNFGSFDAFKAQFKEAGVTEFGSGWTWLIVKPDGSLAVVASNNQDNPLMDMAERKGTPILTCDVWEHAYYLKYLNRRDEYMDSFWNVVNWQRVEELLDSAVPISTAEVTSSYERCRWTVAATEPDELACLLAVTSTLMRSPGFSARLPLSG